MSTAAFDLAYFPTVSVNLPDDSVGTFYRQVTYRWQHRVTVIKPQNPEGESKKGRLNKYSIMATQVSK